MKPSLSVVVPVYNNAPYLRRCLESILTQSFFDFELICVNDGSTDQSLSLLEEFSKTDTRIKIININHKGPAYARNVGIAAAQGELLGFVDADDYISNEMFATLIDVYTQDDVELVGCGIKVHYEAWASKEYADAKYYKVKLSRNIFLTPELFRKIDSSVCNKFFKRELIEQHQIKFPDGLWYEDAAFVWCYLSIATRVSFIPNKFYNYIRYEASIMGKTFSGKGLQSLDHLRIVEYIGLFLLTKKILKKYQRAFYYFFLNYFWLTYRGLPFFCKHESFNKAAKVLETIEGHFSIEEQNLIFPGRIFTYLRKKSRYRFLLGVVKMKILDRWKSMHLPEQIHKKDQ